MTLLTRDQVYAEKVYDRLKHFAASAEGEKQQYGGWAHRLPILIRTAGLAQALSFAESKGSKGPARAFLQDLAGVLGHASFGELAARARSAELSEYMWLTQESLTALLWFKRFAQSILEVTGDADGQEPTRGA